MKTSYLTRNLFRFLCRYPLGPSWTLNPVRAASEFQLISSPPWGSSSGAAKPVKATLAETTTSSHGVDLRYKPKEEAGQDYIQTYYLPWKSNTITFFILPAKPIVKLFFTASISGCSIFICPQPDGRVAVFHAGTETWGGNTSGNLHYKGRNTVVSTMAKLKGDTRPLFWKALFLEATQTLPIERIPLIEVTAYDYMDKAGFENQQDHFNLRTRIARKKQLFANGCVCGEWTSEFGWIFYLQTKVISQHSLVTGMDYCIFPTTVRTLWPAADLENIDPATIPTSAHQHLALLRPV